MKAADPSIKVGAVIEDSEDEYANYPNEVVVNPRTGVSHSGWSAVMLATFKQLDFIPDFVSYHRYEQAPGSENDAYLLGAASTWASDAALLRQMLTDYLGPKSARTEIPVPRPTRSTQIPANNRPASLMASSLPMPSATS